MVPTASLHTAQGISFALSPHHPQGFETKQFPGPCNLIWACVSNCRFRHGHNQQLSTGPGQVSRDDTRICTNPSNLFYIRTSSYGFFDTSRSARTATLLARATPSYRPPESFILSSLRKSYTEQFDILSLGRVPSSQFSDRVTRKVGTFTSHFSATHRTHNGTEVHGIRHQPNRILRHLGKQPATQHLPSLKSISPTGIVPTAWRMGNQTSESMVGSSFSFLQDCLVPSAGVGS